MKARWLTLASLFVSVISYADRQPSRPNILLIMTDDHAYQGVSAYGHNLMHTPNIDRIANEGIRLDRAFVANSISGPSRACILTGKYSHINGFTDNSRTFDGDQPTFPKILREQGYQTAMIGKWHLNSAPQGFDTYSILIGQGEYYSPQFYENGDTIVEPGYVTDIITDKALDFIDNADSGRPWAMLYYHKAPHRNWMPAQRHLNLYADSVFAEPVNLLDDYSDRGTAAASQEMMIARHMWPEWDLKLMSPDQLSRDITLARSDDANKDDVSRANDHKASMIHYQEMYNRMTDDEKAAWNRAYAPRIAEWDSIKTLPEETVTRWKYQQYMKDYAAVIRAVDENVGRVIAHLDSIGQLDNTIIVYTSDQGFFLGEHGWFDKRFMYEECQRTPMVIRYPALIRPGSSSDALVMNLDLAPTFIELAGGQIPADIQGLSLQPLLEAGGKAPEGWRDAVYYHYYEYPSWHSVKRHYGIRTDRYKLIHFYNDIDEWELYDLETDPHEMHNLYSAPEYADVRAELHRRLTELQQQLGDTDPDERNSEFFSGSDNL